MNKEQYRQTLQNRIAELKKRYDTLSETDYAERGITLGKINAYYDAIILSYEIE